MDVIYWPLSAAPFMFLAIFIIAGVASILPFIPRANAPLPAFARAGFASLTVFGATGLLALVFLPVTYAAAMALLAGLLGFAVFAGLAAIRS